MIIASAVFLAILLVGLLGIRSERRSRQAAASRPPTAGGPSAVAVFEVAHPGPDMWTVVGRYTREPLAELSNGDEAHQLAAAFASLPPCVDAEVAAAGGGQAALTALRVVAAEHHLVAAAFLVEKE